MAAAKALLRSLMKNSHDQIVQGPTIEDCVTRFIAGKEHELGDKTAGQYTLLLGRLVKYAGDRGARHMKELTVDLLEDFKVQGLPGLADTTKGIATAKLRCFLRVAFRRGWTQSPLAEGVSSHTAVYEQKEPYSDEEVRAILQGASGMTGGRDGYASAPETFQLLLELMLETGMRVSDAVRFNPSSLEKGESGMWIYTYVQTKRKRTKAAEPIEAYLSDRLKVAIDGCKWMTPKAQDASGEASLVTNRPRPFWVGLESKKYAAAYQVYDLMKAIGKRCGVADCRPHRLRDTFAVRALLRGLGIGDVSRLLGHSSVKITEQFYARWVPARRRRLEGLVAESLNVQTHHDVA